MSAFSSTFTHELLDRLLSPDAVPLPDGDLERDPRMRALCDELRRRFDDSAASLAVRAVHLFGLDVTGIARRNGTGVAACVDVARHIVVDRANRHRLHVPADLLTALDQLNDALIDLAASTFPELVQPELGRKRALLSFYRTVADSAFFDLFGARCHLALARKARGLLTVGTRDLNESLRAQITPLKLLHVRFVQLLLPFHDTFLLRRIDTEPRFARSVMRMLYRLFESLPNSRDPSRTLSTDTVNDYYGVALAMLDSPAIRRRGGPTHKLYPSYGSYRRRWLDDDPPEESGDPYARDAYEAEAERDARESAEANVDAELIALADPSVDEYSSRLADEPMGRRMAILRYAREAAVLANELTVFDTATVPKLQLAMAYAALTDPFVSVERLDYARLLPLALLHLTLTTGRRIEDLLSIRVGTTPASGWCDGPIYDPAERALFASPRLYPGLPSHLRQAPDPTEGPEAATIWRRAMTQHESVYVPVTDVREIVLDDFGRWLLDRLMHQRRHLTYDQDDALFFHVDGKSVARLTRETAHALVAHAISDYVRRVIPDAPAITLARLRHTAWTFMVEQASVHPILMQMQSDQVRMDLYSHQFYANVSRDLLRERINAAQLRLTSALGKAFAEHCARWPSPRPLNTARAMPKVNTTLALPRIPPRSLTTRSHYGARYCVRQEVLHDLVNAELHDVVHVMTDAAAVTRQHAWHNAVVKLLAHLTSIVNATRISEVVELPVTAVDLTYDTPIVTFEGKGNRFFEECRTLIIPTRLVPLWQAIVAQSSSATSTRGTAFTIYRQHGRLVPLRHRDLWNHLSGLAVAVGLPKTVKDFHMRWHAHRHTSVSGFIARGVSPMADLYWHGHQTLGAEPTHYASSRRLRDVWREVEPHLTARLDELGVTEAVVREIVERRPDNLLGLLPPLPSLSLPPTRADSHYNKQRLNDQASDANMPEAEVRHVLEATAATTS